MTHLIVVLLGLLYLAPTLAAAPPASTRDAATSSKLEQAYRQKGDAHVPRTRHLDDKGRAKYVNRLILEASPYLLQHAHNPVDWRAWGAEALAEAAALDRPIFLSVGYSTCHWCHVMEEESFDDEGIAAVLNAHFIPIKVDREQHPALDLTYVTATRVQRGYAGWPNSVWLTPDGQPFYTATYLPREQLMTTLLSLRDQWRGDGRGDLLQYAASFASLLQGYWAASRSGSLGTDVHARAASELLETHNELEGGFSQASQFPREGQLLFLLDHWQRTGEADALATVTRTLDAIARGGIHDHVGGGFHRYAIDPGWRIPHFEKMLYTQALLSRAFLAAWQISRNPAYARAARRAFDYVLRDMTAADGAFHTAEDADSRNARGKMEEGAFYVWPEAAVRDALGPQAPWALAMLGLTDADTGAALPVAWLTSASGIDVPRLDSVLESLRLVRDKRQRPLRDEKVIAGWNGLMIRALAEGGVILDMPALVHAAERAAHAVIARLWTGSELGHAHVRATVLGAGELKDYTWFGLALVSLHDATGNTRWLDRAVELARQIETRFADGRGRLKMSETNGPLGPVYSADDATTPSGESSALELFAQLDRRTQSPDHRRRAGTLLSAVSGAMSDTPALRTTGLVAARVLDQGERGVLRALAKGAALVSLQPHEAGWQLSIRLRKGWHANAHDPGSDWLIGASMTGASVQWPKGRPLAAGFSDTEINVYDDALSLPLSDPEPEVELTLQICSDELCLPPESTLFRLSP